ncbi:hypothetical protein MMC09_000777 [Bachmanniomyces sp. S44760]|nr:hypothetical protein [Bachmanniomyces sp. S44760]
MANSQTKGVASDSNTHPDVGIQQSRDPPPGYGLHQYDEVFTTHDEMHARNEREPSIRYFEDIPVADGRRESVLSTGSVSLDLEPVLSRTESIFEYPLSITMENEMIYPTVPPSSALYHLPRPLTFHGESVYIRRNIHRGIGDNGKLKKPLGLMLYELKRVPYSNNREISIKARNESCVSGSTCLKLTSGSMLGTACEVRINNDIIFVCRWGKWKSAAGKVIAVEGEVKDATRIVPVHSNGTEEKRHCICRVLVMQEDIGEQLRDLLMASWSGKVWLAKTGGTTIISNQFDEQMRRQSLAMK